MKTQVSDMLRSTNYKKYHSPNRDSSRLYESKAMSYAYEFPFQNVEKNIPSTLRFSSNRSPNRANMGCLSPNRLMESQYQRSVKHSHGKVNVKNKNCTNSEKHLPKSFIKFQQKLDTDRDRKVKIQNKTNLQKSGLTDLEGLWSSKIWQEKQKQKNKERYNSKCKNMVEKISIPSTKSINPSQQFEKELTFDELNYSSSGAFNQHLTKSNHTLKLNHDNQQQKFKNAYDQYKRTKQKKILDNYFNTLSTQPDEQKQSRFRKHDNIQTDREHYQTGFLKKSEGQTRSRQHTKELFDFEFKRSNKNSLKIIPRLEKLQNQKDISTLSTRHTSLYQTAEKKILISDFQIGKCLGRGRFGKVYQAIDKKTGFLVALKMISKETIKSNNLEDQITLEIKIQMYLSHPNIVKLFGVINQKDNIYLILEYLEQGSLYQYLKNKGKLLPQKQISPIVKDIVSSIKYLHDLNVVHRDLKPQNILISNKVFKLGDFGWATLCNERRKTNCGTLDYFAPEIIQGQEYDQSIDLWCVGVLVFELLAGKVPFYHLSKKQTAKKIVKVQKMDFPSRVSQAARDFTQSLLVKDPSKRLSVNKLLIHPFITKYENL